MRRIIAYVIAGSVLSAFPGISSGEYIRATKEEELILIPTESEVRMGKSLSSDVEKKFGIYEDASLQKRVDGIGQRIASVCDRKDIRFYFKVLQGEQLESEQRINAFALPGGYVYMFKDMADLLENDDEIAAILAHEIGHITAKHSIKKLQGSLGAAAFQILSAGMAIDGETRQKSYAAIGHLMMSYSKEDEAAADRLSVKYMKSAGYNPEAILSSIDKMMKKEREMPIRTFSAYRTHPSLAERKAVVKKEIYGRMDFEDFINAPAQLGNN